MAALLMLVSYIISLITIGMCLFLKVPQIINLYQVKRTGSLSIKGLLLELTSYSTMTCYNYANGYSLLTYLEYPIILIQEIVLIYLALFYKGLINQQTMLWFGLYVVIFLAFLSSIVPTIFLSVLAPLCTPISASSKIIQLLAIIRSGTSQGISMTTWFISAFTNLSRAFTVYLDSADPIILSNFGISTILSASVMAASYVYRPKYIYVTRDPSNTSSPDPKDIKNTKKE